MSGHTSSKGLRRTLIASTAVVCVVSAIPLTSHVGKARAPVPSPTHAPIAATVSRTLSATRVFSALPPADLLEAMQAQGTSVTLLDPVIARPAISGSQATEIAAGSFFFTADKVPLATFLAKITIADYGTELETDPTKPSRIDPSVRDRTAWIVVYDKVQLPVFGPFHPEQPQSSRPDYYTATFFVAVDASSGGFLSAESL